MVTSGEPAPRASWPSRVGFAAMTAARLALGLGMLPYGISKLYDLQFQVGASQYAKPLGEAPGTALTWAFLGYSSAFQFLLGAFETIPAILLLFTRTRRLGAVLLFPVVLNVAMFNYFLDLWPSTQVISGVLLALNVFLLVYDFRLYFDILKLLPARPAPIRRKGLRIGSRVVCFLVCVGVVASFGSSFYSSVEGRLAPIADFTGERQINRSGTWKVESLRVDGQAAPLASNAGLYFDFTGHCVFENGTSKRQGSFEASKSTRTFRIAAVGFAPGLGAFGGSYRVEGDRLFLEGKSADGVEVDLVLRRGDWGPFRMRI